MNKPEELTVKLLKELIGDRNIPALQELIKDKPDNQVLNLIDKQDYIAMKLWSKEDIISQITKNGFKPTDENVNTVLNSHELKYLNDCTDEDWEIIKNAIFDTLFPPL